MKCLKEPADWLHAKIAELSKELGKKTEALKTLQDMCEHDWVNIGHDSHHAHEKCTFCGLEDLFA